MAKQRKRTYKEISPEEKEIRSERMKKIQKERAKAQRDEKMIAEGGVVRRDLTKRENDFCELYVWGGVRFAGKHGKCYHSCFGGKEKHSARNGRGLLKVEKITLMVKKMREEYEEMLSEDKVSNREALRSIRDEMVEIDQTNRFGEKINTAANRNVAINAVKILNAQDGHDKPKEVNITGAEKVSFVLEVVQPKTEDDGEEEG